MEERLRWARTDVVARAPSSVDATAEGAAVTVRRSVLPWIDIMGVRFHALREAECVQVMLDELRDGRGGWVVTPNLDHLRRLAHDESLRADYAGATLSVADGMPLVWASRIQRTPLPERVAGSNLIYSLTAAAGPEGRSFFFLGGDPGTAEESARVLHSEHPELRVAGVTSPPLGFERDPAEMARISTMLTTSRPDVVFVALGSPKQERLIRELRPLLPRAWWLGIGISFSFVSNRIERAPLWAQRVGLEWFHRMLQDPRRLVRRYLIQGLPFAVKLFGYSAMRRMRGSHRGLELRQATPRAAALPSPSRKAPWSQQPPGK